MFTYEINIAIHSHRTGLATHYAKVVLAAGTHESTARAVFEDFTERFTANSGYSLELSRSPVKSSEVIAYSEGA